MTWIHTYCRVASEAWTDVQCNQGCGVSLDSSRPNFLKSGVLSPTKNEDSASLPWMYFLHLSLSSVILTDSPTGSPVHLLMLSIQAMRAFLACVHLALFLALSLSSWCDHSALASLRIWSLRIFKDWSRSPTKNEDSASLCATFWNISVMNQKWTYTRDHM